MQLKDLLEECSGLVLRLTKISENELEIFRIEIDTAGEAQEAPSESLKDLIEGMINDDENQFKFVAATNKTVGNTTFLDHTSGSFEGILNIDDYNSLAKPKDGDEEKRKKADRCQILAHILNEVAISVREGKPLIEAHPDAIDFETTYRSEANPDLGEDSHIVEGNALCSTYKPGQDGVIRQTYGDKLQTKIIKDAETQEVTEQLVRKSGLIDEVIQEDPIFLGRITKVGEAPGMWGLSSIVFQSVEYEIVKVIEGDLSESRLTISHIVYPGDDLVLPDHPELNPSIFFIGNQLLIQALQVRDQCTGEVRYVGNVLRLSKIPLMNRFGIVLCVLAIMISSLCMTLRKRLRCTL